jgi:hypothetical protein
MSSEGHKFDPVTGFCTSCGCHSEVAELDDLRCFEFSNVVAISHTRARTIMAEIVCRPTMMEDGS